MSAPARQLLTLLRVMVRMDFRSRAPLGTGQRSRSGHALQVTLVFYCIVGAMLGFSSEVDGFAPTLRQTLLLAVVSVYLMFSILIEYQQILLAPQDNDVLGWRPISSRTLFAARSLHVFLYVNLLSTALLAVPSLLVALSAPGHAALTWLAFVVAGMANAALVTATAVLLYSLLLRHVPATRVQNALVWFQVLMSLVIFLGYQALGPLLARAVGQPGSLEWLRYLPSRWFVGLPEMVGWGADREAAIAVGIGFVVTVAASGWAVRHLAPQAQQALAAHAAEVAATEPHGRGRETGPGRLLARLGAMLRGTTERAGYDFFLAMFRGDVRLKATLLPLVVLPVAFLLYGLVQGVFPDPYASDLQATVSPHGPAAEQAVRVAFLAAYFQVFTAFTLARSLATSPSWKAGWVYYTSPLEHFDRFQRGVLWGAACTVLLPTLVLFAVLLQVLWRNPLHVLLHLAIPVGLVCLSLPVSLWLRPEPPFSREPMRHDHMGQMVRSVIVLLPMVFIAVAHYLLRQHAWVLLSTGGTLALVAGFLWSWARQRVHLRLHARAFDA